MNTVDSRSEVRSLACGIRVVVGVFTLVLCYIHFGLIFSISHFEALFKDMLGDKALPLLTAFVIKLQNPLLLFSLILPVLTVVVLWKVPSHKQAMILCSVIMGICLILIQVIGLALCVPLSSGLSVLTGEP